MAWRLSRPAAGFDTAESCIFFTEFTRSGLARRTDRMMMDSDEKTGAERQSAGGGVLVAHPGDLGGYAMLIGSESKAPSAARTVPWQASATRQSLSSN